MRSRLALVALLALAGSALAQEPFTLHYRLAITGQGYASVEVEVAHAPTADTVWSIGGASPDFGKDIRDLSATGADGRELAITALAHAVGSRDDQRWVVANAADESFTLRWRVVCSKTSHEGADFESGSHRPSLFADWAVLFGHATFLIPFEGDTPAATVLEVETPAGWPLLTDFGPRLEADDVSELHWILIAAGNWQRLTATIGGAEIHVALRPPHRFTIDHAFTWIRQIVETQVEIFGSHPVERFLVLILPSQPGHYGGSVYRNTIELQYPADETLAEPESVSLIAHEHFHLWNGHLVAPDEARPEGHFKWFSEGATVYYEKLTLFRAGLVDLDGLVASLNDALTTYWTSPARARATRAAMEQGYWTAEGFEEFGYQGGAVRALVIDALLQGRTKGAHDMDELMRRLAAAGPDGPGLDDERLARHLTALDGGPWDDFFREHVEGVQPLPLEALTAVGLAAPLRPRVTFELGFEIEGEFRSRVPVTSVVPGSAAEAAGLRPGDLLTGYGLVFGDPDHEVDLQVERAGESLDVRFLPRREEEVPTLEIVDRGLAEASFR